MESLLSLIKRNASIRYPIEQTIDRDYCYTNISYEQLNALTSLGDILLLNKQLARKICFSEFLNFKNYYNHSTDIHWKDNVDNMTLALYTAIYIIFVQVFTDGNHRTALYILTSNGYDESEASILIDKIRRNTLVYECCLNNTKHLIDTMPKLCTAIIR